MPRRTFYHVGKTFATAVHCYEKGDVLEVAATLGDGFAIWKHQPRHWGLILDRTVPQAGQLPALEHVRNVLGLLA